MLFDMKKVADLAEECLSDPEPNKPYGIVLFMGGLGVMPDPRGYGFDPKKIVWCIDEMTADSPIHIGRKQYPYKELIQKKDLVWVCAAVKTNSKYLLVEKEDSGYRAVILSGDVLS